MCAARLKSTSLQRLPAGSSACPRHGSARLREELLGPGGTEPCGDQEGGGTSSLLPFAPWGPPWGRAWPGGLSQLGALQLLVLGVVKVSCGSWQGEGCPPWLGTQHFITGGRGGPPCVLEAPLGAPPHSAAPHSPALGVPAMGRGLPWKWERGEGEGAAASSRDLRSLVLGTLINPRVWSCLMSPPPLLPMGKPSSFCSSPKGDACGGDP